MLISKVGRYKKCRDYTLQYYKRIENNMSSVSEIRYGVTATKKVGKAVLRNKIKRRIRAIIGEVFPFVALPGFDYVIIVRKSILNVKYIDLKNDLTKVLQTIS